MSEEILDYDRSRKARGRTNGALYIAAVVLFIYWFIAGIFHWPFAVFSLLTGLFLLALVSLLKFVRNRKTGLYQLFYFVGKVSLLVAIFLNFSHFPYAQLAMWMAFAAFGGGIILLSFKK
ncbi:MAG TPA: hypothetical protein VJ911_05925 [Cryomorphaceae bacterium]|nr:hypothetical protein [Cryomorphaceae bacterium]